MKRLNRKFIALAILIAMTFSMVNLSYADTNDLTPDLSTQPQFVPTIKDGIATVTLDGVPQFTVTNAKAVVTSENVSRLWGKINLIQVSKGAVIKFNRQIPEGDQINAGVGVTAVEPEYETILLENGDTYTINDERTYSIRVNYATSIEISAKSEDNANSSTVAEPTPIPNDDNNSNSIFTDLNSSHWSYYYVSTLTELGIISGYPTPDKLEKF